MDNKTLVDDDTNTNVLHANALENDSKKFVDVFLCKTNAFDNANILFKLTNQCK